MSKIVIRINVAGDPFLSQVLDKKARVAVLPDVFKNIGSEYISGTNEIIRGLPPEMEEALMPVQLGITRNTPDYDTKLRNYWAEFTVKVRGDRPLELDMSTTEKTLTVNGEVKKVQVPVNLLEYMQGYFALQSSQVAKTDYEKSNVDLYSFLLDNLEDVKKGEVATVDVETKAMQYYVELAADVESAKVAEIFQMLRGKELLDITYDMTKEDKKIQLNKVFKEYPNELIKLAEDKNLTLKAKVRFAIDNGIITKEGDTYFLEGDDIALARGQKEMLTVFSDPNKSLQVSKINARIEQLTNK